MDAVADPISICVCSDTRSGSVSGCYRQHRLKSGTKAEPPSPPPSVGIAERTREPGDKTLAGSSPTRQRQGMQVTFGKGFLPLLEHDLYTERCGGAQHL